MDDVFHYNTGSLLAGAEPRPDAGRPERPGAGSAPSPTTSRRSSPSRQAASTALRGAPRWPAPCCTTRRSTRQLGLEIPTTWDEFIANSGEDQVRRRPASRRSCSPSATPGRASCSCSATSPTSTRQDPNWADRLHRTNKAKYVDEPAFAGFEHTAEVHEKGLAERGLRLDDQRSGDGCPGHRQGRHVPDADRRDRRRRSRTTPTRSTTSACSRCRRPTPLTRRSRSGSRTRIYIPKTTEGDKLEAAKKFVEFANSTEGCEVQNDDRRRPRARTSRAPARCPSDVPAPDRRHPGVLRLRRDRIRARVPLADQGTEPREHPGRASAPASPPPRTAPRSTTRT